MTAPLVRAAGGVVRRTGPAGTEVLLVHRGRYDDWSLPKGKLDPGESEEEAAAREVREETGLACLVRERLGEARYRDALGRAKVVVYFLMEPLDPGAPLRPHDPTEIDDVRWLPPGPASDMLTYDRDREILAAAAQAPGASGAA